LKTSESTAHPSLTKDNRPFGIQFDDDGCDDQQRKRDGKQQSCEYDIHTAFEHEPPKSKGDARPDSNPASETLNRNALSGFESIGRRDSSS
jgi:hypothetical protein